MTKWENRCKAYAYQAECSELAKAENLFSVPCCRFCVRYDKCKRHRCENDPEICRMYRKEISDSPIDDEMEDCVIMDGIPAGNRIMGKDDWITQYDPDTGELLGTYNTLKECERATGASRLQIQRCCRGENKTAGGYVWRYEKAKRKERVPNAKIQPGCTCASCKWLNMDDRMKRWDNWVYRCENPQKREEVYYKKSGLCKKYEERM